MFVARSWLLGACGSSVGRVSCGASSLNVIFWKVSANEEDEWSAGVRSMFIWALSWVW